MKRKLHFGIALAALMVSTIAQAEPSIHWAGPPKLPPVPSQELSCPAGARILLLIEDTKQPLSVYANDKYAFIVSPFWKSASPAILVARPGGWIGARPPATMDLTPLTGSADARVYVRTSLNDLPDRIAKLHGYIGCDRWQATISGEGRVWPDNEYTQVFVLKRN